MRTLLLVLAALVAGFGAGYLARGRPDVPSRTARRPTREPMDGETGPRAPTDLARALAALPTPEPRRGDGRIEGTVRTTDDRPLAGVRVRAMLPPDFERPRRDEWEKPRLEDEVRWYVRWKREQWANTIETTSDPAGAFALTGLADAEYRLSAHMPGYELTADGDSTPSAKPGAKIEFFAYAVREVQIDVLLPDGTAPDVVQIFVHADGGEHLLEVWRWTPDDPSDRLSPGAYALRAEREGHTSDPVRVVVPDDGTAPVVTLRLRPKPGLRGKVTFAEGRPLGTIKVQALRLGAAEQPEPAQLPDAGETAWVYGVTYEFDEDEVGRGRFLVGVVFNETVVAWRVVEVGDGLAQCDFHVEELSREDFVAVEVRGPGGAHLGDFEVLAGVVEDSWVWTDDDSAFRLRDGGLLVAHYPADEGGRRFVEVVSERFGRKRAYYERGQARPVRIEFGTPGRLSVTLRGYVGSGNEGLWRGALVPSGRTAGEIARLGEDAAVFGDAGEIAFGPVEVGRYLLVVYIQVGDEFLEAARHDLRLRAGENRLAIPIPALHRLVVRAPGLKPGTVLELDRGGPWPTIERRVGEDGRAVFLRLPAGRYKLWREDHYDVAMHVELPHAGELRFEPKKRVYDAMRVFIRDRDGMLARAGFRDDDLVIGVGGTEFENQRQMQLLMVQAAAKPGAATLLVQRGGRRLELKVDLQALIAAGEDAGGGLAPASR
jgi:hypothetical protein